MVMQSRQRCFESDGSKRSRSFAFCVLLSSSLPSSMRLNHRLVSCLAAAASATPVRSASSRAALAFVQQGPWNSTNKRSYDRNFSNKMSENDEVAKAQVAAANRKDDAPQTIFDKILSGDIPSDKVFEDDDCLAFRDINPVAPTHIVLIPKKRDGLTQLSKAREDQTDILGHLLYVAGQLGKKECPQGFRIVINDGAEGSQSVYHLHVHICGGRQMTWPPG